MTEADGLAAESVDSLSVLGRYSLAGGAQIAPAAVFARRAHISRQ